MCSSSKRSLSILLAGLLGSCGPAVIGAAAASGGGGDGKGPPPVSSVQYQEGSGPDTNVIRFSAPQVIDKGRRLVSITLEAKSLTDKDLFGLSFSLNLDNAIGARLSAFSGPSDPSILVRSAPEQDEPGRIVFGVASLAPAKLLPADFQIGTLTLQAATIGNVELNVGPPGLKAPSPGIAFVKAANVLKRVLGPAVRGGTLVLE
ncbi:MAG: hypothetical protein ACE5F1_04735 [Planctomycetota bacterium]